VVGLIRSAAVTLAEQGITANTVNPGIVDTNILTEEAKVALRGARRDANEMVKEALKEGSVTEDDERKGLKTIQETTDKSVTKVDEIVAKKESEILEV
jgi:ribosome recycling factor